MVGDHSQGNMQELLSIFCCLLEQGSMCIFLHVVQFNDSKSQQYRILLWVVWCDHLISTLNSLSLDSKTPKGGINNEIDIELWLKLHYVKC